MYRVISTICILVVWSLIIEDLHALKPQASFRNGQKRMEKRRYKRQVEETFPMAAGFACNFTEESPCATSEINHSGSFLQNAITTVQSHHLYVHCLVSLRALQLGGMCAPNSNLFTANAFSALALGHITPPQLATLNLFPVQRVDVDTLRTAGYIKPVGGENLLTSLGALANIFGHITPLQLRQHKLYPLEESAITSERLMEGGYLTKDCIPTALGLAAVHIRYLPRNNLASAGCQIDDYSQVTRTQLVTAKYVYGRHNLLTPVGLAALETRFFPRELYQELGLYPFSPDIQTVSPDDSETGQVTLPPIVNDFVHVGYIHPSSHLITAAGYYAITNKYLSVRDLTNYNLWPYTDTPTMSTFVSAGYATYSGHLTTLGYSLLHAQYYSWQSLEKLGIRLHSGFQILHHALRYAGDARSEYQQIHTTMRNMPSVNEEYPTAGHLSVPPTAEVEHFIENPSVNVGEIGGENLGANVGEGGGENLGANVGEGGGENLGVNVGEGGGENLGANVGENGGENVDENGGENVAEDSPVNFKQILGPHRG